MIAEGRVLRDGELHLHMPPFVMRPCCSADVEQLSDLRVPLLKMLAWSKSQSHNTLEDSNAYRIDVAKVHACAIWVHITRVFPSKHIRIAKGNLTFI